MRSTMILLFMSLLLVPALVVADPPTESGIVYRGQATWGMYYANDDGTRLVVYGFDPVEYCQSIFDFDVLSFQGMQLPVDDVAVVVAKGEEIRTTVWPFGDFNCALFEIVPPLAGGTSRVVSTDNNYYGVPTERTNSWSLSAHGVLLDASGDEYGFQHNYHCTWKDDRLNCHSKIRLR